MAKNQNEDTVFDSEDLKSFQCLAKSEDEQRPNVGDSSNNGNVFDSEDFKSFLDSKLMLSKDNNGYSSIFKSKDSFVSGFLNKEWKNLKEKNDSDTKSTIPDQPMCSNTIMKSKDWLSNQILGTHVEIPYSMGTFFSSKKAPDWSSSTISCHTKQQTEEKVPSTIVTSISFPSIRADFSSSSISTTNGTGDESKLKTGVVENKEKKKKRIRKPRNKIIPKVKNYVEVSDADVLQGRGGRSNRHPGNERYRNKVERTQKIYKQTEDKEEKTKISQNLVLYVQSYGGNFLEKDENGWFIIDDIVARRKVSQALREDKDPEKRKAKRQRFLARRAEIEAGNNVDDGG